MKIIDISELLENEKVQDKMKEISLNFGTAFEELMCEHVYKFDEKQRIAIGQGIFNLVIGGIFAATILSWLEAYGASFNDEEGYVNNSMDMIKKIILKNFSHIKKQQPSYKDSAGATKH